VRPGAIRLPEGVGLDLGGIAKGWTADLAATEAIVLGHTWAVVNAGGDVRIGGQAPPLDVAIEDPVDASSELARLTVSEGALATSSTIDRAWDGFHQLIDPRTGASAVTDLVQATVWAPTCAEAEARAKWALLNGSSVASTIPCALVTEFDEVLMSFAPIGAAA
jgi:thiamine biosynthesis lipoprotein